MVGRGILDALGCRGGKLMFYITEGKPKAQKVGNGKYLVGRGKRSVHNYRCLRINQPSDDLAVYIDECFTK